MARLGLSVGNFERHDGTVENSVARRKERRRPDAILGELLADAEPKTAFGSSGLLDTPKKALAEQALNAEMDQHLDGGGPATAAMATPARA
jgi:hypothetical protein